MEKIICPNCGTENLKTTRYCANCGHELPQPQMNTESQTPQPAKSPGGKRDMLIGTILGIVLLAAIVYGVQKLIPGKSFIENKLIEAAANEINKSCPVMIDEATRLDNVAAMPGKALQYNYTLVSADKTEFDIEAAKEYLEPAIIENIKTNTAMKIYRDNNVTLIYNYKDKNGEPVWELTVTPDMYQ